MAQPTRSPKRWIAVLLTLALCLSMLPAQVLAEEPETGTAAAASDAAILQNGQPAVLQTADGEIPVEEDWNEAYPYGTFAFGSYQADVGEAGAKNADGESLPASVLIPVYRLGGTTGAVTAKITFAPAITTDPNGLDQVFDYAASGRDDLRVEVEDPNPLAAYQTPGMPLWQREMQPGEAAVVLTQSEEPARDGAITLGLSGALRADSYRWQAKKDGVWQDLKRISQEETAAEDETQQIKGVDSALCTEAAVEAAWDLLWDFDNNAWSGVDLRCVYTAEGKTWCSESLMGETYTPVPAPEPVPEGLELSAEPGYTVLEADEAYGVYEFDLVFADGETVKYIRVTALDDEISELPELALFTITGCEGGELSGACNTLTLMVTDNDEAGPSTLGFQAERLTADRGENSVRIPVRREGDRSYNVTVRYETVDGTAKAGVDYARAEGELAFAGSVDEIEIPVELIANDTAEERSFTVRLTQLQGGGEENLCRLTTQEITVTLTGSAAAPAADGSGRNLATLLAGADGEEIAGSVTVAGEALLGSGKLLQGDARMEAEEPLTAKLVISSDTRSHSYGKFKFCRDDIPDYDNSSYWQDEEALLGAEVGVKNTSQGFGAAYTSDSNIIDDAWVDAPDVSAGIRYSFQETSFWNQNGTHKLYQFSTNWSGTAKFTPNDTFAANYGYYFDNFRFEADWVDPGLLLYSNHNWVALSANRFLLPTVSYVINGSATSKQFYVTGNAKDIVPGTRTVRCYTTGGGGLGTQNGSYTISDDGTISGPNPWTPSGDSWAGKVNVGFGDSLELKIDLAHMCTWRTDDPTVRAKGLMDYYSDIRIRDFTGHRRTFDSTTDGIELMIYTANDSDEPGSNGYTAIKPNSKLYEKLAPEVSLAEDRGGISGRLAVMEQGSDEPTIISDGMLYVGSVLQLQVPINSTFQVRPQDVYMTIEGGGRVGTVKYTGSTEKYHNYEVALVWEGMTEADLGKALCLNVVYTRTESIEIDVAPSVALDGTEDLSGKYREVFDKLFESKIEVKYVEPGSDQDQNGAAFGEVTPGDLNAEDFLDYGNGTFSLGTGVGTVNLQSVNFHMDHDDVILVNGKAYAGDEEIILRELDFRVSPLTFHYYNKDFLDAISPMLVTVTEMELWYDGNYDGKNPATFGINGEMDEEGYFTPTAGDVLVAVLKGEYPDSRFKPVKDENGVVHQYFLRVNYTMRPRALVAPAGTSEDDKAQILPAFYSAVTDKSVFASLTEEEQSYRWIAALNANDKIMYGADANAPNYVDVPLGGDVSSVTMTLVEEIVPDKEDPSKEVSKSETRYTWIPEYVGSLLVPFQNPMPITNTDNITGSAVALAGELVDCDANGVFAYSEAGRNNINGFLASFTGRTGLAVGVQPQLSAAEGAGITSLEQINPDTVALPFMRSTPSPDNLNNLGGNGDAGEASGAGPGGDMDMEDFAPELGTELPSLEFPLGDYASIVVDGYQIGFTIGLPIFKKEDESYTGSEQHSTTMDGSQITDRTEDGKQIRDVVSADGKRTTHMETVQDPDDPNKRTKTIVTERVDDQGKKTYRREVIEETCTNGGWSGTRKEMTTDEPSTPSTAQKPLSERAQDNFVEANSQMKTLTDFCTAVGKGDRKQLAEFMKGSIMDDDSFKNAKNGNSKMRKVSVSFSVQLAIMFEYNPIDDGYYFKTAGISATLGFEVTLQARLPACPIFYVYLKFGAQVEAAISLSVIRQAVEGDKISSFLQGTPEKLQEGQCRDLVFELDMREDGDDAMGARGFHMDLNGTVYMRVYDNEALTGEPLATGGLSGDGSQKEVLLESYNKRVYVRLEARGDVWPEIKNLKPVLRAESKTVFDGLSITPSLSLEVGAGVGVEVLKFEIFLKTNIAITMTMGGYLEETDSYEGFYISKFEWSIALGFNVTVLFINYSMDVIAFGVEGQQHGTGGYFNWDISASLANGEEEIWSKTTYTTADAKSLAEPTAAYGTNIYKDDTGFTFYNPNGKKTDLSDNAGSGEGWEFKEKVSPNKWWGGGLYKGEMPLNQDLAVAKKAGSYVTFSVAAPKIDLFFKGEIEVWDSASNKTVTYKSSPAKLNFGSSDSTELRVTAKTENTKLDRWCLPSKSVAYTGPEPTRTNADSGAESLIHVTGPRDITATQGIARPKDGDTRALPATGTDDFQLSGYNTAGDAKLLAWGLDTGYSYRLAQVGDDTYVVYPMMIEGVPQLVLSKLVMTGDLNSNASGFVYPFNIPNTSGCLVLDNDSYMDLDFALDSSGDVLTVTWIGYGNAANTSYKAKTRQFNMAEGTASPVRELSSAASYLSQPAVAGDSILWAEASGSGETANAELKAWLLAVKDGLEEQELIPDGEGQYHVTDPAHTGAVFYWATQSKLNALNGDKTLLKSAGGQTLEINGQLDNLDAVRLDGKTYVFYTVSSAEYFDMEPETPLTVTTKGINGSAERSVTRRLYLCSLDDNGFGSPMLLQTIMDFDGCSDSNLSSARLKDGVYTSSTLIEAKADPYYANLRFLSADIDGSGVQTLALFEMGGNTYLITETDLKAAAAGSDAPVTLIPVFSETTGTEVCIGADGEGNMLAVYTAPVANSQSNAIFAAWWDRYYQCWGTPTILAMRHLQVYEDAITYDLDPGELEQAYYGYKTGNEAYDAYLAKLSAAEREKVAGSEDKLSFSNLQISTHSVEQAGGSTATQLLVLTEGSFVPLTKASFDMGEGRDPYEPLIPAQAAETRFYAIAFGAGEQAIGEGSLAFSNPDFTVGSALVGEVSFTNTGTAAIRASVADPATIQLVAGKDIDSAKLIAEWNFITPIPAGTPVRLTFTGLPLENTLEEGTKFFLTVSENENYMNDPQSDTQKAFHGVLSDLMTIGPRPDLSFGSFEADLITVLDGIAYLNIRANVQNLGNADANGVFIQFSYGTGDTDQFGNPSYAPIDINGSELTTDFQKPIGGTKQAVEEDYDNGVYQLRDEYGGENLDQAYYRLVSGVLCVPISCFVEKENFSGLHLRAELYSDFDSPNYDKGQYSFDHNEYNGGNNGYEQTFKQETCFTMPSHINTALGTTLRLPVTLNSTVKEPEITVTEITDGTEGWTPRMGICYYDAEHKAVVAAPNSTAQAMLEAGEVPTGILQVKDLATNSVFAVTYTVGAMADGVNIYKDDATFTFYNADGSLTDLNAAEAECPDWIFLDMGVTNGWTGGEPGEIPMNYDLSQAITDNAYFSFETLADTLEFYFMGEITVSVTDGVVVINEVSATESPCLVELDNPNGELRKVTVKATKNTKIDRYVPTYKINTVVDADPNAPKILWNRSFPDTASLETGGSVPMTCYLLDGSGLRSVKFCDTVLSETTEPRLVKLDDTLWYFDWSFTENGPFKLIVEDQAGNTSTGTVNVDWFNEVVSLHAVADAPGLIRDDLSFVYEDGSPVPDSAALLTPPYLSSAYAPGENETSSAYIFADGAFSEALAKNGAERWLAAWNGCYMVRVERDDGTWARALIPMKNIVTEQSEEQPDLEGDGSPGSPFLIGCREDWLELRRYVQAGGKTAGKYFLQIADVSITDADMIGDEPPVSAPSEQPDNPDGSGGWNPQGVSEYILGGKDSVSVKGWAFDRDDLSAALTIQVYIGSELHEITADQSRPDLETDYPGVGEAHGYQAVIPTELTGKQTVMVCAVNVGEGSSSLLAVSTVVIGAEHSFMGVYDGGGFTLTFEAEEAPANCAPFRYAKNATFRNLRIDGAIRSAEKYAAGLCANVMGLISVENCRSDLEILAERSGECTHGGLIAEAAADSEVTITGCTVSGRLLGRTAILCGGFVGSTRGALTIRDSFFAPEKLEWKSSQNFARSEGDGSFSFTNCYHLGSAVGGQGLRGYSVTPAEDVSLSFGAGKRYDRAGLTAYAPGLLLDGVFYAANEETVALQARYVGGKSAEVEPYFMTSAGTLTGEEGDLKLTMTTKDAVIRTGDHKWSDTAQYDWSEDNREVTAFVTCVYNPNHRLSETVRTQFFLIKPSTLTEPGSGYYLASFADSRFEPQRMEVVIPAVSCQGDDACPGQGFTDMPPLGNYQHLPIDWAVINHITAGVTPTTFGPKKTVTRAQFVTFLWAAYGKPEPTQTETSFTDVNPNAYYYKAVLWAVEKKITSGTSAGKFSPSGVCNRAQVVTFLWAAAGKPEPTLTTHSFQDVKPNAYYLKALLWALEKKITSGTSATTFSPKSNCTRGQVVTFLFKLFTS